MAAMFRPALRTCARQLCAAPLRPLAMPRVGMTSTLLRSFAGERRKHVFTAAVYRHRPPALDGSTQWHVR